MARLTENKIVLISRRTRLEELVAKLGTPEQARFYIERLGSDFSDYLEEDRRYRHAMQCAQELLAALGRLQRVDREHVPNLLFGAGDVVVAVGQDGLVANTLKYLDGQPLIGVNPDAVRWDGVLLPFSVEDLRLVVPDVFAGRRPLSGVSMAKAALNDGQVLYAVNDLFIGRRTHVSARYHIRHADAGEDQSSSGIIVSTGLGATGWMRSVLAGAGGIVGAVTGADAQLPDLRQPWDADYLQFSVREPYPSRATGATVVFGRVSGREPMQVTSHMPEDGVIFSDGVESDFLEFRSGLTATITVAEKQGMLVV